MSEINVNEMQNPIEEVVAPAAEMVQEASNKGGLIAVVVLGVATAVGAGYGIYKWMKKKGQAEESTEEDEQKIIDIQATEVDETE